MNADVLVLVLAAVVLTTIASYIAIRHRRFVPPPRSMVLGGGRMTRAQMEDFMRPADMSTVRRELEDLEASADEDIERLRKETEERQKLLAVPRRREPAPAERPPDDTLTEDERQLLAWTDARNVRR